MPKQVRVPYGSRPNHSQGSLFPDDQQQPIVDPEMRDVFDLAGVKIVGDDGDLPPPDIAEFISKHNLSGKKFQAVLKMAPEGLDDDASRSAFDYVRGFNNQVPSLEYVAKRYGPGRYWLCFFWQYKNDEGENKKNTWDCYFNVAQNRMGDHLAFLDELKIQAARDRAQKLNELKLNTKLNSAIDFSADAEPAQSSEPDRRPLLEQVKEIRETAEAIGMVPTVAGAGVDGGRKGFFGMLAEAAPLLAPIATGIFAIISENKREERAAAERQNVMMLTLLSNANRSSLEIAKVNAGQGSGTQQFKEFSQMIFEGLKIKEALQKTTEEPSMVDRLIDSLVPLLPQLVMIMSMPKGQREQNPAFAFASQYAKSDPQIQEIFGSPEKRTAAIRRLDDRIGWRQADMILEIMGTTRPEDCPHEPEKENPPSERNEPQQQQPSAPNEAVPS